MATKVERFEAEWAAFAGHILSPAAPEGQVRDMRDSFYAGAMAALLRFDLIATLDDESEGMALLELLRREVEGYCRRRSIESRQR